MSLPSSDLAPTGNRSAANNNANNWRAWVSPALLSPVFLGMAPVLGKLAYAGGSDPFTVAALRTTLAAAALWIIYLLVARRYIYIFPAGLLGCVVVGVVKSLQRVDWPFTYMMIRLLRIYRSYFVRGETNC